LVEAFGSENWQDGPVFMRYKYPKAVDILDKADAKRMEKKKGAV